MVMAKSGSWATICSAEKNETANYFFEWLHWFSYPLIAVGAALAGWLWLLPVAMFLFLWFVTGIPHTEKQALKSRGDDYREYQRTTSPFIPWRPAS